MVLGLSLRLPHLMLKSRIVPSLISSTKRSGHHDLTSFIAHAKTDSISPTSTVYTGTYYEYLCAATLSHLSFSLSRTGGRSDHGIDLLGCWHLPSLPFPLRVLVQCKALRAKASPNTVRELEGMLAGAPKGWRGEDTVGILCAKREATKGVREAVRRSGMPVIWIMVEDLGEQGGGKVRQMLWNARVNGLGAEGVGTALRYVPGSPGHELGKEVVLTWKGEVWESNETSRHQEG